MRGLPVTCLAGLIAATMSTTLLAQTGAPPNTPIPPPGILAPPKSSPDPTPKAAQAPAKPPANAPAPASAPKSAPARAAGPKPAAAAAAASYRDLKFPALRPIPIPKIEKTTLPNGMRLYLLEDHEIPVVRGVALVRAGNLFDPPDKIGLAQLTGQVLRIGGTTSKTGDEIDRQLEDVAAQVESGIGETSGSVRFSALKTSAPEVISLFHDVLTSPEFRQDKLDLAKSQYRNAIARKNDVAANIVNREFESTVYGRDNSYGWQPTYATVGAVTRSDLQSFYKRYYFPKNVMLAIWGDFDSAQMKAQVEKLFAGWTADQPEVPAFPKVDAKTASGVYLASKTDVTQTFFQIGCESGEFRDKDYPALETLANILGGGFFSRLMGLVRTKTGNTYSISATWGGNYDHPGLFRITGSTATPVTVETIDSVLKEVDRLRTAEVTEEELKTAKDAALNSLVFAFDTRSKSLERMLTYEYFGYPADFIAQYQKGLEAVTRADILRVAKEHLDPAKMAIVALGNPAGFIQPLDKLGRPVTGIDLKIPDAPSAAAPSPAGIERGKQILAAAQAAAGGVAKLAAVKDFVENAELNALNPGIKVQQTLKWVAPNLWREENTLSGTKVALFTDGSSGWVASGANSQALVGPQAKQANGDLFRSYIALLLSDRMEGRTVNGVDSTAVEISDKNGNFVRVIFDPATHLPKTLSYDAISVAGAPPIVQEAYSDFRDVGGIRVPFKITLTQDGRPYADVTVSDIKFDTGLTAADIRKRP
jgi:zinc protease